MNKGFYYHTLVLAMFVANSVYANEHYVLPDDENSTQSINKGRAIWLQNCEGCHGYGIADAPVPMRPEEWRFRLAKGKEVLYQHAINGYIGPDYSMMPARGGNENLNDEQVKQAVDYMLFLAGYYINKHDMK